MFDLFVLEIIRQIWQEFNDTVKIPTTFRWINENYRK
jgi:hypothetical protein